MLFSDCWIYDRNTTSTSKSGLFYSSRPQGIMLKTDTYITEMSEFFTLIEAVGHINKTMIGKGGRLTFDFVKLESC